MRHWWRKFWRGGRHERFCSCQVMMFVYVGRGSIQPGEALGVDEVEVITSG